MKKQITKQKLIAILIIVFIVVVALTTFLSFLLLSAVGVTKDGINYRFVPSSMSYYVAEIDPDKTSPDVKIASKINSCPVTEIGINVFQQGGAYHEGDLQIRTNVESIYIPKTVTNISDNFGECVNLTTIIIEEGNPVYHSENNCIIKTKNKALVVGCKTSIIPDDGSVTSITGLAFRNCVGIKNITIPNCVTFVDEYVLYNCNELSNISLSLTVLNNLSGIYRLFGTYEIPSSLESITITGGSYIESDAFKDCTGLKIIFKGTKAQWKAIEKERNSTDDITIHCNDGTLRQSGDQIFEF